MNYSLRNMLKNPYLTMLKKVKVHLSPDPDPQQSVKFFFMSHITETG